MIKAQELRIGVTIKDHQGKICTVDAIHSHTQMPTVEVIHEDGSRGIPYLELCEGTPLTEEWLLKFGFECVHKGNRHYMIQKGSQYIHFHYTSYGWSLSFSDKIANKDYCTFTTIEHIHQLQNLYFALTGEELTIKEVATA